MIIDYKILTAVAHGKLEAQVKAAIMEGWQPQGGAVLEGGRYMQTVVLIGPHLGWTPVDDDVPFDPDYDDCADEEDR